MDSMLYTLTLLSSHSAYMPVLSLKDHRQRIPKNYYKINTEETFLPFTVIINKDYFSRKRSICKNLLSRFM